MSRRRKSGQSCDTLAIGMGAVTLYTVIVKVREWWDGRRRGLRRVGGYRNMGEEGCGRSDSIGVAALFAEMGM
jgi:hypothetical protein